MANGVGGKREGAGRKPYVPTDKDRELVSMLVALGHKEVEIVLFVINPEKGRPISIRTLQGKFKKELATGLATANAKIGLTLFQKAMAGDTASLIFWLKTRARWRTTQSIELAGDAGKPPIRISGPSDIDKLTPEELVQLYRQTVQATRGDQPV